MTDNTEQFKQLITDLHKQWQTDKIKVTNNYPSWKEEDGVDVTEYFNPKTMLFTTSEVSAFEGYVLRKLQDLITQVWMESESGS